MQLMRRFTRISTTLYVNSIVMQKPNLAEGRKFIKKLTRKAKSIFTGLKRSDAGFWVYSPFSLPVHHIVGLRRLNEFILRLQLRLITWKLNIRNPIIWVACPAACEVALKMKYTKLVYQRTDRFEEFPGVETQIIKDYDKRNGGSSRHTSMWADRTLLRAVLFYSGTGELKAIMRGLGRNSRTVAGFARIQSQRRRPNSCESGCESSAATRPLTL